MKRPLETKGKYTIRPTSRQRKSAKALSDSIRLGKHMTKREVVLAGDYSETVADSPALVTESKGFLKALDDLGLTDEFIVSSLVEDIRLKPQRRAFELSIAAKIRGLDRRADNAGNSNMSIQNAVIYITPPSNGPVKPQLDHK